MTYTASHKKRRPSAGKREETQRPRPVTTGRALGDPRDLDGPLVTRRELREGLEKLHREPVPPPGNGKLLHGDACSLHGPLDSILSALGLEAPPAPGGDGLAGVVVNARVAVLHALSKLSAVQDHVCGEGGRDAPV